jgi:bacteriophage N4 adsorption protein B
MDHAFQIWFFFRVAFLTLMVVYLISGLDDLIVDVVYYGRVLFRTLFRRRQIKPLTQEQIESVPEKLTVVIVPAWDESNVIARMLLNTINSVRYKNYYIFVGTYPNDEATKLEVQKIREIYSNIEVVVTPADGPTNKADCLNWIYQGIKVFETEHNVRFETFVFHDAEDLVHPLSLKYYNYLMPRVPFVQLPVFPLEQKWYNFPVGVYMDEFAENHTKDLRARETLAPCIPSAGVGTALSRETMDYLAQIHKNQLFDIRSVTEDYLMGLSLSDMPGRKILLQQSVERTVKRKSFWTGQTYEKQVREPIATREFFPGTLAAAVHQKSRWILGIALQGWSVGWGDTTGMNYWLYRDRKSIVANLLTIAGYVVVLYWLAAWLIGTWNPELAVPPLIEGAERFHTLLYVVIGLLCWRVLNRMIAVWRIYGPLQALLSVPRLFYGNYLNFCATCKAIRRFTASKISGKVPAWGKTAHAYPTEAQLLTYRRKLGDLLLERRMITTAQLEAALARQKVTGRKLGDLLVEMGVLWEEDLVAALAQQRNVKAIELDPSAASQELLSLVPREIAERYRVFPIELKGDILVLATSQEDHAALRKALFTDLMRPVALQMTSTADIQFAIARAYGQAQPAFTPVGGRLGQHLLRSGTITEADLHKALRNQKRTGRLLGEVLIEMKLITPEALKEELQKL